MGLQIVSPKSKKCKNVKSKSKFRGLFRGLGGLGVCGNDRKCIQLRACRLWCNSVRKTSYFVTQRCCLFLFSFLLLGLLASRAPAEGPYSLMLIEMRPARVAMIYLRGWFAIDAFIVANLWATASSADLSPKENVIIILKHNNSAIQVSIKRCFVLNVFS